MGNISLTLTGLTVDEARKILDLVGGKAVVSPEPEPEPQGTAYDNVRIRLACAGYKDICGQQALVDLFKEIGIKRLSELKVPSKEADKLWDAVWQYEPHKEVN